MIPAYMLFTAHGLTDCLELGSNVDKWAAYLAWIIIIYLGLAVSPSVVVPLSIAGSANHLDFGSMHASFSLAVSCIRDWPLWVIFLTQAGVCTEGVRAIQVILLSMCLFNEMTAASLLMAAVAAVDTRLFVECLFGCHFVSQTSLSADKYGMWPVVSLVSCSATVATAIIYFFPAILNRITIHQVVSLYGTHVMFHFFMS